MRNRTKPMYDMCFNHRAYSINTKKPGRCQHHACSISICSELQPVCCTCVIVNYSTTCVALRFTKQDTGFACIRRKKAYVIVCGIFNDQGAFPFTVPALSL